MLFADSSKYLVDNNSPVRKKVAPLATKTSSNTEQPVSTTPSKTRHTLGPTVSKPTSKPKAVSKIASLWKNPAGGTTATSPNLQKVTSSKISSSPTNKSSHSKAGSNENVPDYVVAISFREPKDHGSSGSLNNSDDDKKSLDSVKSKDYVDTVVTETDKEKTDGCKTLKESTPRSRNASGTSSVADKTSARITPFLHKPEQKSAPVSSQNGSDVTTARSSANTLSTNFSSQAQFYNEQDNQHITVRLNIKPCITVSEVPTVSPQVFTKESVNSPAEGKTAADDSADKCDKRKSSSGTSNTSIESSATPEMSPATSSSTSMAMTKTEMLLRRRSEILKRRESESSTNSADSNPSSTPRCYTMTKTTEV